jgi:hypothetical protein
LEQLLVEQEPDLTELNKFVGQMVGSFAVEDGKVARGYTERPGTGGYMGQSWSPPAATIDLAKDCLDAGCPVDMTTELLASLKAAENPSIEVQRAIKELEGLLAQAKPNKNELDKVVGSIVQTFPGKDMVGAFAVAGGEEPLGYSGKKRGAKALATHLFANIPNVISKVATPATSVRRARLPRMNVFDLAVSCLEDGCPIDEVSNVVVQLKAINNPNPEIVTAIKDLEKLLVADKPNKNAMASVLGGMVNSFTVIDSSTLPATAYSVGSEDEFGWRPQKATIDLASDCLDEGCPVDLVSDLVAQLKAEKNSSPESQKIIEELEALLAMDEPNKNALSQLVTAVAKGLRANYVTPSRLMEGLGMTGEK